MTSPDLNNTGNAGYGAGTGSSSNTGQSWGGASGTDAAAGGTDDVSFGRNLGVDHMSDSASEKVDQVKDVAQRGMDSAQDAISQLQAKASELTSNLIDKVNVDELTQKLEAQVRDHPARTLLMAAGAGFLLGRAAKK